ncbi:tryptophan-tRNA ligase [Sphaceloma murrayae]|uniref:tryptophan--tRNA ligase n=1 Tax=Sphaceloma murrayae TaxID=2082308 RepID=A0A2K1QTX0_9PEZI|nr:tryptophan-tRNA ligase [Sphaceloma murrayae]
MGYLSRMTQWKSKLELDHSANPLDSSSKAKLKLGLFSYPVLQAADILVHRATHVPVGEDQSQHLEFARECAIGFNHIYGSVLEPPQTLTSPAKRVMAMDRPMLKMSKSHPNPKSRIHLTDSQEELERKIRVALTDSIDGISYDPATRPGVSNLIDIAFHLDPSGTGSPQEFTEQFKGMSLKVFKGRIAQIVNTNLRPIRERYLELEGSEGRYIDDATDQGARNARESADATMQLVREAVGLM